MASRSSWTDWKWFRDRRWVAVVVALSAFVVLRFALVKTTREVTPVRVTSSDRDRHSNAGNIVDHSTVETLTLDNFWGPSGGAEPPWVQLELDGAYLLDRLELLNTRRG